MENLKGICSIILICSYTVFGQLTTTHTFNGAATGKEPYGDLISDGTYLYGMTAFGGVNDYGTIFKILPDGTGFTKILDFAGSTNGRRPYGSLYFDGVYLYGMTSIGGANNKGVVFKLLTDGSGYVKLLDFNGAVNGAEPTGNLISDGTYLYGMTSYGGINGSGVVFKLMPDGTGYLKLLDFDVAVNGGYPFGSLLLEGGYLFGLTSEGGTNGFGKIFKILPDGTGYVSLHDFSGTASGSFPYGSLVTDGTMLYGMTYFGGTYDLGVIFKISTSGTGYVKMMNFTGSANGSMPFGSLILESTKLYGMTSYGGVDGLGVAFKIETNGTGFSKLVDFHGTSNGSRPQGSLYSEGTFLYGLTYVGGTNSVGTIFRYNNCSQPNVAAHATDLLICPGQCVTLTGSGASTYSWNNGVTDGVSFCPPLSGIYTVVGTDDFGCSATDDVFIIVTDCAELPEEDSIALQLFPQPASDRVYIQGGEIGELNHVLIQNMSGQVLWESEVASTTSQTLELTVDFLAAGSYLIIVNDQQRLLVKK